MKAYTKYKEEMQMKKATKCLLGGALVILLLTPVSQVKADWHQDNIGWWYSTNNGSYYKDTLAYIDNNIYRFDERGYMITGWYLEEHRNTNGSLYKEWSYFDPVSGARLEGWQQIDGKWYYFPKYYHAVTCFWSIDGKDYYFDPINCDMQTGWVSKQYHYGTEKLYFDPVSGAKVEGWQEIDGKKYYFGWNGALRNHRKIDGKDYYFDPDTCELKIGWFEALGNKYYADPNDGGALASNKTLIIDGISYTFDYNCILINNAP